MQFEYRSSKIKKNPGKYFIISLKFDLSQNREKYTSDIDNIYFREYKQPKGNSCGSFFKNPYGIIVDDSGQDIIITDKEHIISLKSENTIFKNLSA
jgi:UDP-N-acetylenolpyruvoylglucosamine reductase